MTDEKKAAWAKEQLISMQKQLGRLPKKTDFDEATRSRIKAFLGPWPRALESAGLKEKTEPKPRTYFYTPKEHREKQKRIKKEKLQQHETT